MKPDLIILGDLMLGRNISPYIYKHGLPILLNQLKDHLLCDNIITNLECPLIKLATKAQTTNTSFYAPIEFAYELKKAGISCVSLANNHIFDHGVEGFIETRNSLTDAGILHFGAGEDKDEATKPIIFDIHGISVGFLGFSFTPPALVNRPGVAYLYDNTVYDTIKSVRSKVDYLLVMPHTGIEMYQYPLYRDQKIYHKMMDLGVDLIVGSQSHCVQATEKYKDKLIFYSIGDLLFDHHSDEAWLDFNSSNSHINKYNLVVDRELPLYSLIISISINTNNIEINYKPIKLGIGYIPYPLVDDEYIRWTEQYKITNNNLIKSKRILENRKVIEQKHLNSLRERNII